MFLAFYSVIKQTVHVNQKFCTMNCFPQLRAILNLFILYKAKEIIIVKISDDNFIQNVERDEEFIHVESIQNNFYTG